MPRPGVGSILWVHQGRSGHEDRWMCGGHVEIRREEIASTAASALIAELNQELTARYPEEGATTLDWTLRSW